MERRLYTLKEIMNYLGVSESFLRQLVRSGRIKALRTGNRIKFDKTDVDSWIESNKIKERNNPII